MIYMCFRHALNILVLFSLWQAHLLYIIIIMHNKCDFRCTGNETTQDDECLFSCSCRSVSVTTSLVTESTSGGIVSVLTKDIVISIFNIGTIPICTQPIKTCIINYVRSARLRTFCIMLGLSQTIYIKHILQEHVY